MTNKLVYFIGNWKMFGDFTSIKIINKVNILSSKIKKKHKNHKIVLCVPNILIHYFSKFKTNKNITLGAQNCHHYDEGPFTGAVSASMIKKSGAKYIIIGHSENRSDGDSSKKIKMKIKLAIKKKLNIIFCIGETLLEKRNKKTFSVIRKQIRESLDKKIGIKKIIIAYEPVWCIGTGNTPNKTELLKTFDFIKKELKKFFNTSLNPTLLYGGSVNSKNIGLFSSLSLINGFLIGGASQSSNKFIDIIKNYYK